MRAMAVATAVAATLIGTYLALGGASYAPAKVADPCAPRDWRDPEGVAAVAQQIFLSGLDGAACELDVSREDIVLAFASRDSLARFAAEQGISIADLERLLRSGLVRAINDAERANALDTAIANELRDIVRRISLVELFDLVGRLPGL
jgi:hypothetical protein